MNATRSCARRTRSVPPRRVTVAVGVVVWLTTAGGCNQILDNKRGQIDDRTVESAPAQPGTLPIAADTDDAGSTPPPALDGGGSATCAANQMLCHGLCVAADDPRYGCGSPTCAPCTIAHGAAACAGRTCAIAACDHGFADCNHDATDGCEADLSRATSCGACGASCPPTSPVCAPSGATSACTTGCSPLAPLLCGTECVSPLTSISHCGGCGLRCPAVDQATVECILGHCETTCRPDFHACAGKCVPAADPTTCGATCTPCPVVPHAVATCIANACGFQCAPGFGDCNLRATDGCEAALSSDPLNCGGCGRVCQGTCENGVCVLPAPILPAPILPAPVLPPPDGG